MEGRGLLRIEPAEALGQVAGVGQLLTFSPPIILDQDARLQIRTIKVGMFSFRIYPPFRSGPANYLPVPEVKLTEVPWLLGFSVQVPHEIKLMRMAAVPQLGLNAEGMARVVMTLDTEWKDPPEQLPMDSLRIDVFPEDPSSLQVEEGWPQFGVETQTVVSLLMEWLRVYSKQWWIGRPAGAITGHGRNTFPIDANGLMLHEPAGGLEGLRVVEGDELVVDEELWKAAVDKLEQEMEPPLQEVLLLDARYHLTSGDIRRAIMDAATACEVARDQAFSRIGIRLSESDNDLLRHRRKDVRDRNRPSYQSDEPDHYASIDELWVARGKIAHGNAPRYRDKSAGAMRPIDDQKMGELRKSAEHLVRWLDKLQ
ncbi:MAG: hypothetical protein QOH93_1898 [Chloroflexia bacterium]|nr:hypothetical protein [Chloroflexia bacterium]